MLNYKINSSWTNSFTRRTGKQFILQTRHREEILQEESSKCTVFCFHQKHKFADSTRLGEWLPIPFHLHGLSLSPFFSDFLPFPFLPSFLPSCALLLFPAPSPVLTLLFTPSLHTIPLSHFLSYHTHSQALWCYSISLSCCLPQARWLPSKVDQQKMPAISMPQQLISGFQL